MKWTIWYRCTGNLCNCIQNTVFIMPRNDIVFNNHNFFEGIGNSCIRANFLKSFFFFANGKSRLNIILSASIGDNEIHL